jgi:glucokinase
MVDGKVLRGAHDIAGATGWMALDRPFREAFVGCGCFESMASGEGIAREADRVGGLGVGSWGTARDVFEAFERGDPVAVRVVDNAIELWGMAVANFVSLFDPERIIMGGGVFGPAVQWLDRIRAEAARWAQPVSMGLVELVPSALGDKAGLYGAGLLAKGAGGIRNL